MSDKPRRAATVQYCQPFVSVQKGEKTGQIQIASLSDKSYISKIRPVEN